MVIRRGEIWWASLPEPTASEPGYRRPVLVMQSDDFNQSRIATVIAVVITSNLKLAQAPGNVLLPHLATGMERPLEMVKQDLKNGYITPEQANRYMGWMSAVKADREEHHKRD